MDEREHRIEPEEYLRSRVSGHQNHNRTRQDRQALHDIEPLAMNNSGRHHQHQQQRQPQQNDGDGDASGLFHLQQELLRRELPARYDDIRREQSQRLEQFLRREQVAFQQKQRLAALRDSLAGRAGANNNDVLSASEHGGVVSENVNIRRMGSNSFSLDSTYPTRPSNNVGSTSFRSSEPGNCVSCDDLAPAPLYLPTRREQRERRLRQEQQQQQTMNAQSGMNPSGLDAMLQQLQSQQQSLNGALLQSPVPQVNSKPVLSIQQQQQQQQQQQPRFSSRPYSSFTLGSTMDYGTGYVEQGFDNGASNLEAARRSFYDGHQQSNENFDLDESRSFREPLQQQQQQFQQPGNVGFQARSGQQYGIISSNEAFVQSKNDSAKASGSVNFVAPRTQSQSRQQQGLVQSGNDNAEASNFNKFVAVRRNSIYVPPSVPRQQQYDTTDTNNVRNNAPSKASEPMSPCTQRLQSFRNSDGGAPIDFESSLRDFDSSLRDFNSSLKDLNSSINFDTSVASSIAEPNEKRQRFNGNNSEMLLLEMLNDTIVSPGNTRATVGSQGLAAGGNEHLTGANSNRNQDESRFAPVNQDLTSRYSNRNQDESRASTLTPLSQPDGALAEAASTPMFAEYLLRTMGGGGGGGGGSHGVDASAMPPLPFANKSNRNKNQSKMVQVKEHYELSSQDQDGSRQAQYGDASLLDSPLPLPSRKGQPKSSPQPKKKTHKGQKKNNKQDGAGDQHPSTNPNHIITPSTSTISALSREIRTKMQASSSAPPNDEAAKVDEARPAEDGGDKEDGSFSIPHFASAMEATQASQQAIHDWDRKFGLRRAHSKTMRESCRSRKRVLEFLKGEGARILLLAKSNKDSSASSSRTGSGSSAAVDTPSSPITCAEDKTKVAVGDDVHSHDKFKPSGNVDAVPRVPPQQDSMLPSSQPTAPLPNNAEETSATPHPPSNTGLPSNKNEDRDRIERRNSDCGIQSKLDGPVQLERMFRRASLDCVREFLPVGGDSPSSLTGIEPREADRKQYFAKSA